MGIWWRPDKMPWNNSKAQDYLKWGHYNYVAPLPRAAGPRKISISLHYHTPRDLEKFRCRFTTTRRAT